MADRIKITIDTREQQCWSFHGMADVQRGTVPAGDYALAGDEAGFAIERKSLDDFVNTVVCQSDRFQRELDKMLLFPAKVVIVEADWLDVINREYVSPEITPPVILRRVAELTLDGVTILWCSNPAAAAGLCWRILLERHKRNEIDGGE